jgi:hypothetical protein
MLNPRRLFLVLALSWPLLAAAEAAFTGIAGTEIRFATTEEGRSVLGAEDDWTRATGDFQRRAVVGRNHAVDSAAFRAQQAAAVVAWTPAHAARWRRALEALAPMLKARPLPLPKQVLLVGTDGSDASNAAYTRGNAVMLPATLNMPGYTDAEVMAHELFHVMSRHRPDLATRLYATIGFAAAPELRWPAEWLSIRIANPDAPYDRHLMRTEVDGRTVALMPVLVAGRTELRSGESFFTVMELRLLEVEPDGQGGSRAVQRDGRPAWHAPGAARSYLGRLGGNTGYVIHPEETMADNVAFLLSGRTVRNPALLKQIAVVLDDAR